MEDHEKQIVSIHLESPSVLDRLIRRAAIRRFDWLIATQPISKAYLLCFPVDLVDYKKKAMNNSLVHDGQCVRCGGRDIKVK